MQIVLNIKNKKSFRVISKITNHVYNCKKFILDLENEKITDIFVDGDWWSSDRFDFIDGEIELLDKINYWIRKHCNSGTDKIHIDKRGHIDKIYIGYPNIIIDNGNDISFTKEEILNAIANKILEKENKKGSILCP